MNTVTHTIESDSLKNLLYSKSFKSNSNFNLNHQYLFFHKDKIYGIYKHVKSINNVHFFSHNHYLPCHYKTSKNNINSQLAYYLIRQENKKNIDISIIINKNNNDIRLLWHSIHSKELISENSILIDETIENIFIYYQSLKKHQNNIAVKKYLINYGKYLYNQLSKNLKNLISISSNIVLSGNFTEFLYYLYDGEMFITNQKKIKEHTSIINKPSIKKISNYKLLLNQYNHDPYMKKEFENIKIQFKNIKIPLSYHFSTLNKSSISSHLETSDFLHYIGHTSNKGFLLDENTYFSSKDMSTLTTVPKVLILSSCYGVSKDFRESYFKAGGQLIIYFNDIIHSEKMEYIFNSFYWQFFFRRSDIATILLSIKRKLLKININWIYLRTMGNTSLKYDDV